MSRSLKKNKTYYYISFILVLTFFILWLLDMNVFYVSFRYISDSEYKAWLSDEIMRITGLKVANTWQMIYAMMTWPMFTLSSSIPGMSRYCGIILPVLAAIASYHLYVKLQREYQIKLHRTDSMNRFFLCEMLKESLKLSMALFFAIVINIIIIWCFQHQNPYMDPWRILLTDILPGSFIQNHELFFYILQSLIEHFVAPLVWCTCLQVCAFYSRDRKMAIALPIIVCLAISYLCEFLYSFVGVFLLYLSPQTIMASSVIGINSYGLILGLLFPILCGQLAYRTKRKNLEI